MAHATPDGSVDTIDSNGTIYGWARDADNPGSTITVHIYYGPAGSGNFLGAVSAHYPHGISDPDGNHGFRFTLPEWVRRAPISNIYVYAITPSGNFPAINNGNPYPWQVDVSPNDNANVHVSGGASDGLQPYAVRVGDNQSGLQLGANATGALVGGRPGNTNFGSQWITTPWQYAAWQSDPLPWYKVGDTTWTVACATRLGGGISSIVWDNVEFVDSGGHGAAFQYNVHDGNDNELFNPNEAGSQADDNFAWYSQSIINLNALNSTQNPADPITGVHVYQSASSSSIQALSTQDYPGFLHTNQRTAYWIPQSPVSTWGGYPKPWNTIYAHDYCAFTLTGDPNNPTAPPYNPPWYNANATFYSTFYPYGPPDWSSYATHWVGLPDLLDPTYYEGVEPLSDYTFEKFIGLGAISGGSVIRLDARLTVPWMGYSSAPNNGIWNMYVFPDHVRFHTRAGARTLFYSPNGVAECGGQHECEQTGKSGATVSAAIVTDPENRYALGVYARNDVPGQSDVYQFYQQDSGWVALGITKRNINQGTNYSMINYVVVGTLAGVESQLSTLITTNSPP